MLIFKYIFPLKIHPIPFILASTNIYQAFCTCQACIALAIWDARENTHTQIPLPSLMLCFDKRQKVNDNYNKYRCQKVESARESQQNQESAIGGPAVPEGRERLRGRPQRQVTLYNMKGMKEQAERACGCRQRQQLQEGPQVGISEGRLCYQQGGRPCCSEVHLGREEAKEVREWGPSGGGFAIYSDEMGNDFIARPFSVGVTWSQFVKKKRKLSFWLLC